jgi:hypothetical protein
VGSATSHQVLDQINAAQDRRVAAAIRRDPRVLRVARADLRRWMAADGKRVRPVFREWQAVLHRLTAREIAAFLCSDTPMARRLRQSSPLAGILTDPERRAIRRRYEKVGA